MGRALAGLAIGLILAGCESIGMSPSPQGLAHVEQPRPAPGLWAIVDAGCQTPLHASLRTWPKCASPFWLRHPSGWVVQGPRSAGRRRQGDGFRAEVRLTPGDPMIARIGAAHDGYVFLALTDLRYDSQGRLVGAAGKAFTCFTDIPGPVRLKPTSGGCETAPDEVVRRAAKATLRDEVGVSRIAWIGPDTP